MLTLETEANMGTQEVHRGHSFVGSLGFSRWYKRFGPALAALAGPAQNIFFPHLTLFHFTCPNHPAGGKAVVPRRLAT